MHPYFKIINIAEVAKISNEVDLALPQLVTEIVDLKQVYTFNIIEIDRLLKLSPALTGWLDSIGLTTRLKYAGLPWAAPHSNGGIHTDVRCVEAINLPVYNCDQGYSAWYKAKCIGKIKESTRGKSTDRSVEYIPHLDADAVELIRVSNQHPIWFNTSIPHRGINLSNRPRIILTLRFDCPIPVDTF
jgi:hypothetical protein